MTERFAIASLSNFPILDVNLLLTVVRWLLAITVVGGAAWFVSGLIRRKPHEAEPEIPEKSIVDGR
jgi:hypothetical protein